MTASRWLSLAVMFIALVAVVRHHAQYLRRLRPTSFGAFLETAGWIAVTLVAAAGYWGGFESRGTRIIEIAAAAVGIVFIAAGSYFR